MSRRLGCVAAVFAWALGGAALVVGAETGCSGAKHGKVVGPPPEYEPPEPVDAGAPWVVESRRDAAAR